MSNIYHKHRIVPGHMGGTYEPSNVINLTIQEHAIWHYELWVYYGKSEDWVAWKCLSGCAKDPEVWFTKCGLGGAKISVSLKRYYETHHSPMFGNKHSEKTKNKMSRVKIEKGTAKGQNNPMFGRNHTEETRKKMGVNRGDLSGDNNPMYGRKHSEETRKKIGINRGNMSGKNNPNYKHGKRCKRLTVLHCKFN